MAEESTEEDPIKRDLDALYKDGRKPTLSELADVMQKHNLKLTGWEFPPAKKKEEKSPQISEDEFEFYLENRLRLAELEKTMAVNYGEIKGALDTSQSASSQTLHYTTIKWTLQDDWLLNVLKGFKNTFLENKHPSPRLLELDSLVTDAMQFIKVSYPDSGSYNDLHNADRLMHRLEMIGNTIGELRSLAEARLISSIEKKEK